MAKLVLFLFFSACVVAVQMAPASSGDHDDHWDLSPEADVDGRVHIPWQKGWQIAQPIIKEAGKAAGKEIIKGITGGKRNNQPDVDVDGRVHIPWQKGWQIAQPIIKEAGKAAGKEIIKGITGGKRNNRPDVDVDGRVHIPWQKGWQIAQPIIKEAGKAAGKEIIKGITGGKRNHLSAAPTEEEQWNLPRDVDVDVRVHIPWQKGWEKAKPILIDAGKAAGKEIIKGVTGGKRNNLSPDFDVDVRVHIPWQKGWEKAKPILIDAGKAAGKEIIKGVTGGKRNHLSSEEDEWDLSPEADVDGRVHIPWQKGWELAKPIIINAGKAAGKEIIKDVTLGKRNHISTEEDQWDLSPEADVDGRVHIPWQKGWQIAQPIIKEAGKAAGKEIIKGITGGKRNNRPDVDVDGRINIPWQKGWEKAKPIIKEAGKAAGKEVIKGITGGR